MIQMFLERGAEDQYFKISWFKHHLNVHLLNDIISKLILDHPKKIFIYILIRLIIYLFIY